MSIANSAAANSAAANSAAANLSRSTTPRVRKDRTHLWLCAMFSPLLIAPLWFAASQALPTRLQSFTGLVLILLITCSSVTDLSKRKIFNWTSYTACAWGIIANVLPGPFSYGSIGLANSLCGAALCFALMLIPYTLARGGAGDVKLAAAIGSLVGFGDGLLIIGFAYIVAAVTICGWTVMNKGPLNLISAMLRRLGARWLPQHVAAPSEQQSLLLDQPIPLAGFFAIAVLLVVLDVPQLLRGI